MAIGPNETLFPGIFFELALNQPRVTFHTRNPFVGMNDLVPIFDFAKFMLTAAQHLLERMIGKDRTPCDIEEADAHLAVFEDGTKEAFAGGQGFLGAFALGDVRGGNDSTLDLPVFEHRERRILDGNRDAIPAPQYFLFAGASLAELHRLGDGTFHDRVRRTVRFVMMNQFMHVPTEDFLGPVTNHFASGSVDE